MLNMRTKDKNYLLLKEKNIYGAFLYLALPVMLANLLKSVHELVDTYFIGQMEGSVYAQAGMSVTWPLFDIFLALSVGMSVAGVSIISQHIGAGHEERAKEYTGLLIVLSVAIGAFLNVVLFFCSPHVMQWMGAEGKVLEAAVIYLRVRSFEMVFLFLFAAFQATRQARGDTVTPVILSVITIVTNIILTALFIKGYQMGVFGAALATLIGQAIICPVILYQLFRPGQKATISVTHLRCDLKQMTKLFTIAVPSAASQALSAFGFLILQAVVLSYGETVMAAFSIGNKVANLLLIPVMALGSILAAYVGQNIGAGNKERAKQAYKVSRNYAVIISLIGCAIIYPFRVEMLSLLTNDCDTLMVALEYMFWVVITQPLMALFQNYVGVFNGSGNTIYSFTVASIRLWLIRLPMITLFRNFTDLGRSGVWIAMVVSNFIIVMIAKQLLKRVDFELKV